MTSDMQPVFRALADPTRRQILLHLSQREMSIAQLVDEFPISRNAIKKHLTTLEAGKLISVEIRGKERVNQLEPEGIKLVLEWIKYFDRFWDSKLNKLQQIVEQSER